jgi:hypothetical protein
MPKKREQQAVLPGFELPRWQTGQQAPAGRSRTSIAAAEAIADMAPTLRGRVYQAIASRGQHGATREELAAELDLRLATICGRCRELTMMGLIHDSGTTRPTESGRAAVVMRAK